MYKNRMGWQRKRFWALFAFTAALCISIELSAAWAHGTTTIGIYRPSTKTFFLRNSNTYGFGEVSFFPCCAAPGDLPLAGDWDGDGITTTGLFRPTGGTPPAENNEFFLSDSNTNNGGARNVNPGGAAGDLPIVGDWNANGTTTWGLFRPSSNSFFLYNFEWPQDGYPVTPDITIWSLGAPGDLPIVGDWDGNGTTTIGLYRPSTNTFYLWNTNAYGPPDVVVTVGAPGDLPVAGDWDGNGTTTIGLYRPSTNTFYLWNSNAFGPPDLVIPFGASNDLPVVGDWDGR